MAIPRRRRRPAKKETQVAPETESSKALDALFKSEDERDRKLIDALYAKGIHPVNLWKYRQRRGRPDLDTAITIAEITGGRVSIEGWRPKTKAA